MNIRQKISAEDMRERILVVAEEHFRRIGYAKTAVADIAQAMGMSPANVYRFFPSKLAINDALCAKIMRETDALITSIVERPAPASERLQALIVELHRHNKEKLTNEHRLFDMVEVAMEENWPPSRPIANAWSARWRGSWVRASPPVSSGRWIPLISPKPPSMPPPRSSTPR